MKCALPLTALWLATIPFSAARASAQERPREPEAAEPAEEPARGLVLATEDAFQGYTLFTPLSSRITYLVDMQGEVVHTWESTRAPGNAVYLMDDGSILRCGRDAENPVFGGGGQGGYVERIAWDGSLVWTLDWSDETRMHHHDIEPLPNGNLILIAWEKRTREEAIAAGRDPAQVPEEGLWPDFLVEIEPVLPEGGKVVWEWHAWDHLVQDFDPERSNHGDVTARPERIDINADHRSRPPLSAEQRRLEAERERQMRALGYTGDDDDDDEAGEEREGDQRPAPPERRRGRGSDWLHTNSVDHHPEHDLLLLSVHSYSEIWVIDHSTTTAEAASSRGGRFGKGGDLLYRWGNPRHYGAGDEADRMLFAQHDAHWIPPGHPGAGHVLLFNNGGGRPGGEHSSADELALPFDPEKGFLRETGKAFGPRELVWSHGEREGPQRFFSSFISGVQRLPNGNTLICSGAETRIFEVTPDHRVVWDYFNPFAGDMPLRPPGPPRRPRELPPGAIEIGPGSPPPPGNDGPPPGGPGAERRRTDIARGLFRATRIAPDHPGLAGRVAKSN